MPEGGSQDSMRRILSESGPSVAIRSNLLICYIETYWLIFDWGGIKVSMQARLPYRLIEKLRIPDIFFREINLIAAIELCSIVSPYLSQPDFQIVEYL
jgi:hypothetical protein